MLVSYPEPSTGSLCIPTRCQRISMPSGHGLATARAIRERDFAMTERPPMEISVRESDGVSLLEVHGRLTIGEPSEQLHEALQSVVKKVAAK